MVVVPALHFSALILYVLGLRSGRFSLNDPKHNLRCPEAISLQPVIRDNESLLTPASLSKSLKSLIGFLGSCVLVSANQRAGGGRCWTLATGVRNRLYRRGQVGLDVVVHSPPQASGAGEGASRGKSKKLRRCYRGRGKLGLQVVKSPQDGAPALSLSRERWVFPGSFPPSVNPER